MSIASIPGRKFYSTRLRNERKRLGAAFEAKFGLAPSDVRWLDPELNLDRFEPDTFPAARPRVLPGGLRQATLADWSSVAALADSMWAGRDKVHLLFDSMRAVGGIEVDASRLLALFPQLLVADGDAIVAATPEWDAWALFDVYSLQVGDVRVDVALRGAWAALGTRAGEPTP